MCLFLAGVFEEEREPVEVCLLTAPGTSLTAYLSFTPPATMSALPVLLAFAISITVVSAQVFIFPRCKTSEQKMEVIYVNPTTNPYDLFATTRRSTCGKRAGTTTGNGTYANPYVINVDLSNGLSSQSPDCGVVQTGADTYTITVSVVFSCDGPDPNDKDYTFSCNLNLPTTTISPLMIPSSSANYSCLAPGTILFSYEQTLNAPGDVYASGKEATCSRSAGQGSGSGASGDPYMLQIDVSSTAIDCGVMLLGPSTYSVLLHVQQIPGVVTRADVSFPLTCNFSVSAAQVVRSGIASATSKLAQGTASQLQPSVSLYVVSSATSSSSSSTGVLSSFTVGDEIRLAAQLVGGPATGLHVRDCTSSAGPGLTPVVQLLDHSGCSSGNNLMPPFVAQGSAGAAALTASFPAFKFNGYDTVYFECVIDFCYRDNDLACQGIHCVTSRRKREAADVNGTLTSRSVSTYVTVYSDTSEGNSAGSIVRPYSQAGDGQKQWTSEAVIVVAVLGVGFLLTLLLSIVLGVKVATLISGSPTLSKK